MSYGPNPWQQAHWDWRAAGNFIFGGAGSGLLVFTVASGLQGVAARLLVLTGLALVGLGLLCVWLEIGRPLRAANVFINLRLSWMSREALASVFVFACGLGLAAGVQACAAPLAVVALAFLYCQARIVQGARGIPAWREPLIVPLLVACGLAEGAGLFWLLGAWQVPAHAAASGLFAVLVAVRWALWRTWRKRLGDAQIAPRALAHVDRIAPVVQWIGGALALALALLAAGGLAPESWNPALLAAAGLAVAVSGARFKFTLITRAAFNQGFALARLPVRGVPR
jgi:phenylacetyl-CoA:acceptor oxidoreductase 26-kDa subunit